VLRLEQASAAGFVPAAEADVNSCSEINNFFVLGQGTYVTILQHIYNILVTAKRNDPERRTFRPGGERGIRRSINARAFQCSERGPMVSLAAAMPVVGISRFAEHPELERIIETMAINNDY